MRAVRRKNRPKYISRSRGIDYDAISKEEFVTLMGILQKSKKLQIRQGSQRGKGKRKR